MEELNYQRYIVTCGRKKQSLDVRTHLQRICSRLEKKISASTRSGMDIEGLKKKKKNYYDDDEIDENREIEHE